jgi:RsiW-degrading membrane proteinase PrsW (M82 family)
MMAVPAVLVALTPVVVFLVALVVMDTFRLVSPRAIAGTAVYGAASAIAGLWLHSWLRDAYGIAPAVISRYVAPFTEEAAKAALMGALIAAGRIVFPVEAAVLGFAIGTGFALIENATYLRAMPDAALLVWMVRGFGTAMLQGATTAIFAMAAKALGDKYPRRWLAAMIGMWLAVAAIHSAFNHRWLPPVAQALIVLIVLPLVVLWVFARSEAATREWIGAGLDLDLVLIELMTSQHFEATRFGRYLAELRARMPGSVVADMWCLLRIELELSVQAKALLMARDAGVEVPIDNDLAAALAEREVLKRSIGKAGLLAIEPLRVTTGRDLWHQRLLQNRAVR